MPRRPRGAATPEPAEQPSSEAVDFKRGQHAAPAASDMDPQPDQPPLEQIRRKPGASMAPQLSMNTPSGEQPAFGGGMAPPPAGTDSGGLFGLAARTPKFEPELASQSQSLFMPKRKDDAGVEPEQAPESPAAQEPPAGLPTLPPVRERAAEPPAPEPMSAPPLPERPLPERPLPERPLPERPFPERPLPERPFPERPQVERQTPDPMPAPPLPERPQPEHQMPERQMPEPQMPQRPAAAHNPSPEHQPFAEPAPLLGGPPAESTQEAMPPVERRQPAPPRPDETQVAQSPRFDQPEEPSAGTQPRNEFEQYAPPQQQFGAPAPDARSANPYDRGQQNHQQNPAYGDAAYAPLAPQLEPDQSQWSPSYDQPHEQPYGQPYDQSYDQPYGQPQDGSQEQFGQPYDPYGQNVYTDATLVGQPPVGAASGPGGGPGSGPNTPAPPPMAPQGYDPYGNGYDARYEPPRRDGGSGKSLAGIGLKRWGLIVLVLAVVVAIIAFVIGLLNNNDDAKADAGTTQGAGTTAAGGGAEAQAKKIDALIQTSAKDKAAIGAAQADLKACENIDEAIKAFEDAAASREKLATKVAKIDTAVLPGSQKVVKNLESAWMTAQNADLAFAAWGEKRKVNDAGECIGGKGKLEKATTLSLASHDPKKAAAKAWGPIAEEYGLDSVEWRKL